MDDEQKERERLASGGVSQCVEAAGFHGSCPSSIASHFKMRPRISIRGSVRPSIGPSVGNV